LLALISCSAWNLMWIFLGYMLGSNWETVRGKMAELMAGYNLTILIFFGLVVLFFVIRKVVRRNR